MDSQVLVSIVLFYVVLLISLTFHEASHALVALLGGDRTAYSGGQVTLNPIPHIRREPFGTVILPLLILAMSSGTMCLGYAHIPVDPYWAERHPKRAALMSAAGPAANFLLALIAFFGLKIMVTAGLADPYMPKEYFSFIDPVSNSGVVKAGARILSVFVLLNVVLGVFNLFPWPPLDGAGVVQGLFQRQTRRFYDFVRSNTILLIIGMIMIWRVLDQVYVPVLRLLYSWI